MKLWIDDVRPRPNDSWDWVKTSSEAIIYLVSTANTDYFPDVISFDHDLGGDDTTMPVVNMLEEMVEDGTLDRPFQWQIHSMNPVGKRNLLVVLMRISEKIEQRIEANAHKNFEWPTQ